RITEIPFGTTTSSLIDSILKANDKGKIKIKKIIDNTAKNVEIDIELPPGVSPDVTIDALYAFTLCEQSISPNACVIINDKPHFLTVEEILRISTQNTKELLKRELEIKQAALNEKWHLSSLEKIFIENKIYRDIEEAETWEQVMEFIYAGLFKYVSTPSKPNKNAIALYRDITDEDVVKLTEIKIKRISKYDAFKADEYIKSLEEEQKEVAHHLAHLTEYAIAYFEELYKKYSKGQERKTEIRNFEDIAITQVAANNTKLYANYKEGFIGSGLKKDEFIADCSDIDDIIVFRRDGVMVVSRIEDKKFVGKDIIYVSVWKKNDERMTYHMIYADLKSGKNYVKRFPVTSITRDKEYQLTKSDKAKVIYFSAHPNSEEEKVQVSLSANSKARIKKFDYDFADLAIKGRNANGNVISKYPIRKVEQIGIGESTLGGIEIWIDTSVGRLNKDERGKLLGKFNTGNKILVIYTNGEYELTDFELTNRYEMKDIALIEKYNENKVISVVYFDGENKEHYVKRFQIETKTDNQKFGFISEHKKSAVEYVTTASGKTVYFKVLKGKNKERVEEQVSVDEFIDIKGWKAQGNKLSANTITGKIRELEEEEKPEVEEDISEEKTENKQEEQKDDKDKYKPGDTLEFDF
ncbi:MAG: DNA gyrase/topoisomerase IV subunit A, partial [Chitinophagales bacterium]